MKLKKLFLMLLAAIFMLNFFIQAKAFAKSPTGTIGTNSSSDLGRGGGGWYAPNGREWTQTGIIGNPITRPTKIVYIPYNQLAIMSADALIKNDFVTIRNVIRDKGTAAAKYIPYLGDVWVAYEKFNNSIKNADNYCNSN